MTVYHMHTYSCKRLQFAFIVYFHSYAQRPFKAQPWEFSSGRATVENVLHETDIIVLHQLDEPYSKSISNKNRNCITEKNIDYLCPFFLDFCMNVDFQFSFCLQITRKNWYRIVKFENTLSYLTSVFYDNTTGSNTV